MKRRCTILFLLLTALCVALFIADVMLGASENISFAKVIEILLGGGSDIERTIVINIRLVRTTVALLAGLALAISGLEMQVLFRNPLAGPYILGVSAGASLGVAIFLLGVPLLGLTLPPALESIGATGAAWIGSAAILVAVVLLSRRIKDIMVILILGMMLSSGIGAVVEILQYFSDKEELKQYVIWTMGSLGNVTSTQLALLALTSLLGTLLAIAAIKPMNLLLAGERYAVSMGLNIGRARLLLLSATTLLAGTVTAFCGPIGFVGIAAPHIARMLFRSADHRTLLPATMAVGGVMMLTSDIIANSLSLPINAITALMGIPIVAYIVTRKR